MNTPKLRFPEFRDAGGEWQGKKLNQICEINPTAKKLPDSFIYIDLESVEAGVLLQKKFIQLEGAPSRAQRLLKKGDVIFQMVRPYQKNNFLFQPNDDFDYVASTGYAQLRAHQSNTYLYQYIHNERFVDRVLAKCTGSNYPAINSSDLAEIRLEIPQLEEQQKIADCLSSIDDLITAQTQKLATLKAHKKGLMQQLFPAEGETVPKLRFPEFRDAGEWEAASLGDKEVSTFVKERTPLEKLKLESYVSTENLLPDYAGVTTVSKLPPTGSFTRFKKGDILISNIRPYLKKVWSANKDGASSNDVIVIRAQSKVSDSFLSFLLKNDEFINYIMIGAKGVKMPRGDISLMKEYPVAYPSTKEQQKIADCLSSVDDLITAQTQKVDALKIHKKGLMQQLFPVVDEVGA